MQSRRSFVKLSFGFTTTAGLAISKALAAQSQSSTSGSGVLFESYAIPPRQGVQEATLTQLKDGRYWLLFRENQQMVGKISTDHGRSWGETSVLRAVEGTTVSLGRN